MASPLTVTRNQYHMNRKNSSIYTPKNICNFIYREIVNKCCFSKKDTIVIDPAVGDGRLIESFTRDGYYTIGWDIEKASGLENNIKEFRNYDFLGEVQHIEKEVLCICNPPFNNKAHGRRLLPEIFTKKIFRLYGEDTPLVLFTPMGFCLNQRKHSKRWRYFRDECEAKITGRIALPLDIFEGVEFHSEILLWNLPQLDPFYWVPEKYLK